MPKKKTKSKKSKNKIKRKIATSTVVMLIALPLCIISIYRIIQVAVDATNIIMVEQGSVTAEDHVVGFIIREEVILKEEAGQGRIMPIRTEGERVARGEGVARYNNYDEEDLRNRISELDIEIQSAMENQENTFSQEIRLIERQIENQIDSVRLRNNIQEILEYQNEISRYVTRKARAAGELSPPGSPVRELIDRRTYYENEIYSGAEYIRATRSGVISYRVDNLEEILTVESIPELSRRFLDDLNIRVAQRVPRNDDVVKIVNNFRAYIATNVDSDEARQARVGQRVRLRLPEGEEIRATIHDIREDEDGSMFVVFRVIERVETLIEYRKINLDVIWWELEGLKVPYSAIMFEGDRAYVVRNRAGVSDKILVKILRESGDYFIVGNYSAEELRGMDFTPNEINNKRSISMFDEVRILP